MGQSFSKKPAENVNKKKILLTYSENEEICDVYTGHCADKQLMRYEDFESMWRPKTDQYLFEKLSKFFNVNERSKAILEYSTFAEVYVAFVLGHNEDKVKCLWDILSENNKSSPCSTDLKEYARSIVSTSFSVERLSGCKNFFSWVLKNPIPEGDDIVKFANAFQTDESKVILKLEDISAWFLLHEIFQRIHRNVYVHLYSTPGMRKALQEVTLFPFCNTQNDLKKSIFDTASVLFLNLALPQEFTKEWRLAFSTLLHGESFSTLCSKIVGQGPTLIIIKDADNYVFGGFAAESWKVDSKFAGRAENFLFTLHPKMRIYHSTTYNTNFQYLNVRQQTLPNGLGMGGQLQYFGLFIDEEFGTGRCSDTCSTYKIDGRLSYSKEFKISHLEVWVVGPKPISDDDDDDTQPGTSILDKDVGATAMLEMAGKARHSEGIREPVE